MRSLSPPRSAHLPAVDLTGFCDCGLFRTSACAANAFLYVPAVPRSLASKLLRYLNLVGEHGFATSEAAVSGGGGNTTTMSGPVLAGDLARAADAARLEHVYRRSVLASAAAVAGVGARPDEQAAGSELMSSTDPLLPPPRWRMRRPTEGYVTLDPPGCGGADQDERDERFGDDTLHRPFRSSWQPIFVATDLPPPLPRSTPDERARREPLDRSDHTEDDEGRDDRIDVVFFDFIKPDILSALNVLSASMSLGAKEGSGPGRREQMTWTEDDVDVYIEGMTANTLMEEYAKRYWQSK